MRLLKLLTATVLLSFLFSCGNDNETTKGLFSIEIENAKSGYTPKETLSVSILNNKQKGITGVTYSLDGKFITETTNNATAAISLTNITMGAHTILASVAYDGKTTPVTKKITVLAPNRPKVYGYKILETYPHDIKAYTQGLEFKGDTLLESTGLYKESSLRKTNYKTGAVYKKVALNDNLFGEGLTYLNDKIYQLTWRKGKGLIYDAETLKQTGTFNYVESNEGWGLCNDGMAIYKSDGSEKIWKLDLKSLKEKSHIEVYTHKSKIDTINELEWVENKIYANIWQKDAIAIINPSNGAVEGIINLKGIKEKVTQHDKLDFLNGIAYKGEKDVLYITGKNWDKLFKIKVTE